VYRDIPEEMRALIEPIVDDHGLELVDVDLKRGRAPWTLRVIVDTPEGDGLVPVERCAGVSREIGSHLDAEDLIPSRYTLEVSSPGLDRVLAREKDFAAACGREVKLETRAPRDGRRRFRGRLVGFDDEVARLLVDGEEVEIAFADVARANTVYEFTREDFARRAGR
jgi:ribosome maturation factor RimP